jgi:hypothetical protein
MLHPRAPRSLHPRRLNQQRRRRARVRGNASSVLDPFARASRFACCPACTPFISLVLMSGSRLDTMTVRFASKRSTTLHSRLLLSSKSRCVGCTHTHTHTYTPHTYTRTHTHTHTQVEQRLGIDFSAASRGGGGGGGGAREAAPVRAGRRPIRQIMGDLDEIQESDVPQDRGRTDRERHRARDRNRDWATREERGAARPSAAAGSTGSVTDVRIVHCSKCHL